MVINLTASDSHDRSAVVIVVAGGIVLALSFGVRSVFGGVIEPLSADLFSGKIEIFSLALAIQNLVWGLAQPVFGLIADKFGDRRAMWLGFLFYLAGMGICVLGSTSAAQYAGAGLLVGMGISGTAFGTVMTVVGRSAPKAKRTAYLGYASALGSTGQVVLPLLVAWLTEWLDWRMTLLIVTGLLLPMAFCIPLLKVTNKPETPVAPAPSLTAVLRYAFGSPSYMMLGTGFFVCGFHLAFITAHLPNYVQRFCITPASADELRALGMQALALAGLANIFGTLAATKLGSIFPKPYVLSAIYATRAVVILVFIALPLTPASLMIFAVVMGVLWLSTVPLTSSLVLTMFGPRALGTLFGFVFLAHQLGSFTGVWLGGALFDRTGSYDQVWQLSIALGALSALTHLLVKEETVATPDMLFGR